MQKLKSVASRFYNICRENNVPMSPCGAIEWTKLPQFGPAELFGSKLAIQLGIGLYWPIEKPKQQENHELVVWNISHTQNVSEAMAWKIIWANMIPSRPAYRNVRDGNSHVSMAFDSYCSNGLCAIITYILQAYGIIDEEIKESMLQYIDRTLEHFCHVGIVKHYPYLFERSEKGFHERKQFVYNRICQLDPNFNY